MDAAAPIGFISGIGFAGFLLSACSQLLKAWWEMRDVENLDKDNRRILAQVNQEIQKRINP